MKKDVKKYTCCICKGKFEGYGNNPAPLKGRYCCNACDMNYVMPVRNLMSDLEKKYESGITPYYTFSKLLHALRK